LSIIEPRSPANRTVAERIAEAFARHGVTVTFGQSIPTAFHLAAPEYGIRQAAYRTENAGGAMADAYTRITNRVGVEAAAERPATARAPLIVAGGGIHLSGATEILTRLQDDFALPVATMVIGKGAVAETRPLSLVGV
jgi:acetolactate synthase-1/2/3 large subunit